MIKEAIAQGATVEEAFAKAYEELGVDPTEAEQEVLELPVKKTLGLFGGKLAKVRVWIETPDPVVPEQKPGKVSQPKAAAPAAPAAPAAAKKQPDGAPVEKAAEYLKAVLREMGLTDVTVTVQTDENGANLNLSGEDIGFIIGHRGETLDALQYLSSLVANHVDESYYRITLDVGNYREKRKETLEALGKRMALRAVKSGWNTSLEPMNPYERRIIHTAVQAVEGAKSWSEGEDMNRHVVIGPEGGERSPRRDNRRNGGRDGGRRSGGGRRGGSRPSRSGSSSRPDNAPRAEGPKSDDPGAPIYGRIEVKK